MRVLLNALQAGNRSGTGEYSWQLARWLPQISGDIEVFILWPSNLELPVELKRGDFDDRIIRQPVRGTIGRLHFDQFGIVELVKKLGADFVHYPASISNQLGTMNTVVTIHDLAFLHDASWFRWDRAIYYRMTMGRSARHARRVIADSSATADDLHGYLGIPNERVDVVHLGVDEIFRPMGIDEQERVRDKYKLRSPYFLYYGTIEPRKNLSRLIAAWSRSAESHTVELVIAGRHGWKTETILSAVHASKFRDRIHMPGFVAREDLPAMISAARALLWPSLWEGFGLPPLEAMACGTPVLTSNVSSLPEICENAALLVAPDDEHAIEEGIRRLAVNDTLCIALSEKGPGRASQFTWRATAARVAESYARVRA
jgi:glycosyltransferase involved in cell wall biosynthesis